MQDELPRCEQYPEYHSLPRTLVEMGVCLFLAVSYIPQYLKIVRHGTRAISSRFVLFHCLSSTLTLALRLQHPMFYDAFNCVNYGSYRGWKAYSSLLGFIQAIVQFLAALIQLVLYLSYRTPSMPDDLVEHPGPGLTSTTLNVASSTVAITVLPVSVAFLWHNKDERFDVDNPANFGDSVMVYVFWVSLWTCLLIPTNMVLMARQFEMEIQTVRVLRTRGSLSLVALLMQGSAFILLAAVQSSRSWAGLQWLVSRWDSFGSFVENLLMFYGSINTHMAYFLNGLGFLVVAFISLHEGDGSDAIQI